MFIKFNVMQRNKCQTHVLNVWMYMYAYFLLLSYSKSFSTLNEVQYITKYIQKEMAILMQHIWR